MRVRLSSPGVLLGAAILLAGCSPGNTRNHTYTKEELEALVVGKTHDEVIALLGLPDAPDPPPKWQKNYYGDLLYLDRIRTPDGPGHAWVEFVTSDLLEFHPELREKMGLCLGVRVTDDEMLWLQNRIKVRR